MVPEEVFAEVSISAGALRVEMKAVLHWPWCAGAMLAPFPIMQSNLARHKLVPWL